MAKHDNVIPYKAGSDKKQKVTEMFDNIAPSYDLNNRMLSLGIDTIWRTKAIKLLKKGNPQRILDIATGTADLAIEAAKVLKPTEIIGMDIAKEMLKVGDKKIIKKGLDSIISLEHGDSEALRYEDQSFDAVMAAFGVRNFENLQQGLSEMQRVLKPGGTCMILEFSKPRTFPIKQAFNLYFKYILPVIAKVKSNDQEAYDYLYESVQAFPEYDDFAAVLKKVGFKEVSYKPQTFGICTIYLAKN